MTNQEQEYQQTDFKSPLEWSVYQYLKKLASKHNFKIGYETEAVKYVLVKKYFPDFVLTFEDGRKIFIEAKGYFRGEDRTKLLSVMETNPGIPLHIVFAKNNKINKKSKSRYADWAERYNIPHALNRIPQEWLDPTS